MMSQPDASTHTTAPVYCSHMAEVRAHIDALDAQIVPLLALRCGYVAQAGASSKTRT